MLAYSWRVIRITGLSQVRPLVLCRGRPALSNFAKNFGAAILAIFFVDRFFRRNRKKHTADEPQFKLKSHSQPNFSINTVQSELK